MVQITRIYTRSGDKGRSSLGDGTRRKKSDVRFAAIGSVDEANAVLGVVLTEIPAADKSFFKRLQNDLFDLGADLAVPHGEALRISAAQVEYLEQQIDHFNAVLSPLNSFILPGGSKISAWLHMARTIIRRSERELVELNEFELVNPNLLRYINRLSDLMFVLSRHYNEDGKQDVLWKPGENN
jgi:cob(I)alamin adenosyltransferase